MYKYFVRGVDKVVVLAAADREEARPLPRGQRALPPGQRGDLVRVDRRARGRQRDEEREKPRHFLTTKEDPLAQLSERRRLNQRE